MDIRVHSKAFAHDQGIPKRYSQDGQNLSPPLNWSGVPAEAKELALIVDDPDAPTAKPWVHWVMYAISPTVDALAEAVPRSRQLAVPSGALQGKNTSGKIGYDGPAPPHGHGKHHYHFKLYALDKQLNLRDGLDKEELLKAMEGRILAQGELVGIYER